MPRLTPSLAADTPTQRAVVWLPQDVVLACMAEASARFPLETGGTFMGWHASRDETVVTAMIGPGPAASHARRAFQPDQKRQLQQIARRYQESGRRETYLGDWHTHPGAAAGALSRTDRRMLRRVIAAPRARCPRPVLLVFWGCPQAWRRTAWIGERRRRLLPWNGVTIEQVMVRVYCRGDDAAATTTGRSEGGGFAHVTLRNGAAGTRDDSCP